MTKPLLTSPIISLRPVEPEDVMLMYTLENDTTMWNTSSAVQPLSHKAITQFISNTQSDIYTEHQLRLTIQLHKDDTVSSIGFVDLIDFSPRHLRAEVGIGLLPDYQKQSYGTIALQLLEDYASTTLFIHQLYAYVSPSNKVALSFFLKNGYQKIGELKDWIKTKEKYTHIDIFQKIL